MRFPPKRTVLAALVAVLVLAALDVTLLYVMSPSRPTSSGAISGARASSLPAGQSTEQAGEAPAGAAPSTSDGRTGTQSPSGTSGRAKAGAAAPADVTVGEAAALPSANVHPGYSTPADAVDGFYHALLGGTPTQACAYVTSPCPSYGSGRINGMVSILDSVSDGGEALVEVTGTICRAATCVPLLDRVMMPAGPATFSASWTSLTSGVYGWAASPLPCVRDSVTGRWLVKLA